MSDTKKFTESGVPSISQDGDNRVASSYAVTKLPDGVHVEGDLDVGPEVPIKSLPGNLSISGNLRVTDMERRIREIESTYKLPDNAQVSGDLRLPEYEDDGTPFSPK